MDDDDEPRSNRNAYALAAVAGLVGVVILWIAMSGDDKHARSGNARDARVAAGPPPDAATVAPAIDAGVLPETVDAAVAVAIDAGPRPVPVDAAAPPVDDKKAIAKELVRKARRELSEGNYEVALQLIDEALDVRKTPDAYVVQADVLRRLKRTAEAVESCDLAIQLNKRYASAWKMKGNILWGAGRQEEARPALEQYLELDPDGEDADSIRARLEGR